MALGDDREERSTAARRLTVCLSIVAGYSLLTILALIVRVEAHRWGFILDAHAPAAVRVAVAVHGAVLLPCLALLMWARRRPAVHPLLPRIVLATMPLLLLASVDRILTIAYAPPFVYPCFIPHPRRDWTFRPGWSGTIEGQPMRVNSHGLPGPQISYEKADDEYRVLFLGDSVAAGYGVREEDCFVQRLSALANARGSAMNVTSVNCSVTSYSPWQEVDLLATTGMRYDPDTVVQVFCLNDYVEKFQLARFGGYSAGAQGEGIRTLLWSGIYRAIRDVRIKRQRDLERRLRHTRKRYSVARLIDHPDAPEFKEAWRITFDNLSEMISIARDNNRPFAIVCFPYAIQLQADAIKHPAPQARLADFARSHGVPLLDLLPVFRAHLRNLGGTVNDLFFDSAHATPTGHAIAAEHVYTFLLEHGLLPPSISGGTDRSVGTGDE